MKKLALILFLVLASAGVSHGAELLVKARDAIHEDPVEDKTGCYKRGDIAVVEEDGHEWGKEERLPKFFVVIIPDLSVDDAKKYIESEWDYTPPENPIMITRRKYEFLVDETPSNIKDELNTKGKATVTWDEIKGFIEDKETGVTL